jgi:predicted nucleic acid-binding protein
MISRWIVDASPLIVLANIGQEALFSQLAEEVLVPQSVAREVRSGPKADHARQLILRRYWRITSTPKASPALNAWDLGAGETSVIAFAMVNPGWTAILDDGAARRCAKTFGIPVKGTLAIVLLARQHKLISSARALLLQLRTLGFRIDDRLVAAALSAVGEEWP